MPVGWVTRKEHQQSGKKRDASIETLSKMLGHTSIKTTLDEYGTEDLEDVKENYKKIMQEIF